MFCRAIWWNVIGIGSLLLICAYGGLVMFAYYHDCDPIKSRQVAKKDQLFPLFVMQVMGDIPGVPGLFVAGVFSGALSTVSSGLNSLAAVCLKDFFGSGCNLKLSEDRAALVTKLLAVLFGVIGYGIVFLVKYLPGVLEVITANQSDHKSINNIFCFNRLLWESLELLVDPSLGPSHSEYSSPSPTAL